MKQYRVTINYSPDSIHLDYETFKKANKKMNEILKKIKKGKIFSIPNVDDFINNPNEVYWLNPKTFAWIDICEEEYER